MNEQATVLAAWTRVRPTLGFSPQLQRVDEFFNKLAIRADINWEQLAQEVRAEFNDVAPAILTTLLATDDPIIVLNAARFANLADPKELAAMTKFIATCDVAKHQTVLQIMATRPELQPALKARPDLPASVRAALN
jgi:ABC-type Fe2+-enterobactin transport system substrate-binding protein